MARKLLAIAALLLLAVNGINAERTSSSLGLRDALADKKYDAHAEFADFDDVNHSRRLQSGSVTEETRCNTWCKLKESAGLTIVGLILICIR